MQEAKFDERLLQQMCAAREYETVEAIVLVGDIDNRFHPDDRGLAARIVEDTTRVIGEKPTTLRILPRTNTLIVKASPAFLLALAEQNQVRYLSATSVDFFIFGVPDESIS